MTTESTEKLALKISKEIRHQKCIGKIHPIITINYAFVSTFIYSYMKEAFEVLNEEEFFKVESELIEAILDNLRQ